MYKLIIIGFSAVGTQALSKLLPQDHKKPVVIVQCTDANRNNYLPCYYSTIFQRLSFWASLVMPVAFGHIYAASRCNHLLVENDITFSLSVDNWVNYSRSSIDALFVSAADVFGEGLVGVIFADACIDGRK